MVSLLFLLAGCQRWRSAWSFDCPGCWIGAVLIGICYLVDEALDMHLLDASAACTKWSGVSKVSPDIIVRHNRVHQIGVSIVLMSVRHVFL
jgi:hypothetical protein